MRWKQQRFTQLHRESLCCELFHSVVKITHITRYRNLIRCYCQSWCISGKPSTRGCSGASRERNDRLWALHRDTPRFKRCTAVLLVFIQWTPESQSITGDTHHSSLTVKPNKTERREMCFSYCHGDTMTYSCSILNSIQCKVFLPFSFYCSWALCTRVHVTRNINTALPWHYNSLFWFNHEVCLKEQFTTKWKFKLFQFCIDFLFERNLEECL